MRKNKNHHHSKYLRVLAGEPDPRFEGINSKFVEEMHEKFGDKVITSYTPPKKEKKMYKHRDANGKEMPVSIMSDDHLVNTIAIICDKIGSAKNVLEQDFSTLSPYQRMILGVNEKNSNQNLIDDARDELIECSEKLGHYVVEAVIRELDVRKILTQAYGRDSQMLMPGTMTKKQLSTPVDYSEED